MDLKEKEAELKGQVRLSKVGKKKELVWAGGTATGEPVVPEALQQVLKISKGEARLLIEEVRGTLLRECQEEDLGSKRVVSSKKYQEAMQIIESKLKGHIAYTILDDQPALILQPRLPGKKPRRVAVFDLGPDFSKGPVLNQFIAQFSKMYDDVFIQSKEDRKKGEGFQKIITEVTSWIEANLEDLLGTTRKQPTFATLLQDYLTDCFMAGLCKDLTIVGGIKILSWRSPAICRLSWKKLSDNSPTPAIDSFINRIDYPKEFMAFIWKIFKEDEVGRQYGWGWSFGEAGQSTFWNVVSWALKGVVAGLGKSGDSNEFTNAELYNKRLAILGDNRDRNFQNTMLMRNITGGDTVRIGRKFKAPFSGKIWCRVFIHSNYAPEVDTLSRAEMSRLLLFKVKPIGPEKNLDIEKQMRKEFWSFLRKCKKVEAEVCKRKPGDNSSKEIPMPEGMRENIFLNCERRERASARHYLINAVEACENSVVSEAELLSGFKAYLKVNWKGLNNMVESLSNKDVLPTMDSILTSGILGVKVSVSTSKGSRPLYLGIKLRDRYELEEAINEERTKAIDTSITIDDEENPEEEFLL